MATLWYVKGADQGDQMGTARQFGYRQYFRPATTSEANRGTWINHPHNSASTFDGIGVGDTATLQVRIWDGAKFVSFDEAVAGGEFGASQPRDLPWADFLPRRWRGGRYSFATFPSWFARRFEWLLTLKEGTSVAVAYPKSAKASPYPRGQQGGVDTVSGRPSPEILCNEALASEP